MKRGTAKLVLGIVIGLLLTTTVYAVEGILVASSVVGYDNTNSSLSSTNVQDSLDELYTLADNACLTTPFKPGDYIEMTPTSTSFTPDRTLTGLVSYDAEKGNPAGTTTVDGTLNPSYLNIWRVIRINNDCTVEVVSEYVTDVTVKIAGKVGFANYIYYLNEIAKQYANTAYTLDPATAPDGAFRNIGYDHQTKQITNMSKIESNTVPWGESTGPNTVESLGGGDIGYATDYDLLERAGITLFGYSKGEIFDETNLVAMNYYLSSRVYAYYSSSSWYFGVYIHSGGCVITNDLRYKNSGSYVRSRSVRPIVTLKSGLTPSSGDGTINSHYTFS